MHDGLKLPAELTISQVSQCCSDWLGHLRQGDVGGIPCDRLALDASDVREVDGAGVQLLIALAHAADKRGIGLELVGVTPALSQACTAAGAECLLSAQLAAGEPA